MSQAAYKISSSNGHQLANGLCPSTSAPQLLVSLLLGQNPSHTKANNKTQKGKQRTHARSLCDPTPTPQPPVDGCCFRSCHCIARRVVLKNLPTYSHAQDISLPFILLRTLGFSVAQDPMILLGLSFLGLLMVLILLQPWPQTVEPPAGATCPMQPYLTSLVSPNQ